MVVVVTTVVMVQLKQFKIIRICFKFFIKKKKRKKKRKKNQKDDVHNSYQDRDSYV